MPCSGERKLAPSLYRTGGRMPQQSRLLSDSACFLALARPQIIQFGATYPALFLYFNPGDARRVDREYPLNSLAVGDSANGKSFVQPAAFPSDDNSTENLNSFLIAFYDARVNVYGIAHAKLGLVLLLLFFDDVDDAIHNVSFLAGPPR